jgi:hypothetical protein
MKIHPAFALMLVLAPPLAGAEISLDSLKEGAAKAAQAVGDTTKGAVESAGEAAGKAGSAVKDTVDSTKQSLSDEATPAATRTKLDAMAKTTLRRLFAQERGSRALFERSAGYAVFDKREASYYVVAGLSFFGVSRICLIRTPAVNSGNSATAEVTMGLSNQI